MATADNKTCAWWDVKPCSIYLSQDVHLLL